LLVRKFWGILGLAAVLASDGGGGSAAAVAVAAQLLEGPSGIDDVRVDS
jgi:hypothetical protein